MSKKGLYIHIPFCKSICSYCAFSKIITSSTKIYEEYFNKLLLDLKSIEADFENINTIYIGGGTPNSVPLTYLKKVLDFLDKINPIEYTVELNPELITVEQVDLFKKYKINRISIGVETISKKGIKLLNRNHDKKIIKNSVKLIKDKLTKNISLDLIFNYPNQSFFNFKKDIKFIKRLNPAHISAYDLIIEDGTKINYLINKNKLKYPSSDKSSKFYDYIIRYFKKYGYNQYEISSFSKEGFESIHNKIYWENKEYYGIGMSAVGFIDKTEISQSKNLNKYLKGEDINFERYDNLSLLKREIMMGLRCLLGINYSRVNKKYDVDIFKLFPKINEFINLKLLKNQDGYIRFTKKGLFLGNIIFEEFVWKIY